MAVDVFGNIIDAFLFPGALNAFCVKTIGLPEAKDQNEQTADLVLQHVVKTVALQRSFMVTLENAFRFRNGVCRDQTCIHSSVPSDSKRYKSNVPDREEKV